jgi:DNA polymerase
MNIQQSDTTIYEDINCFLKYLKQMGATGADIKQTSLQCIRKWEKFRVSGQETSITKHIHQKQKTVTSDEKQILRKESFSRTNDSLTTLLKTVKSCKKCNLHKTRTQIVFGAGDPKSHIVFVGEAPGFDEDKTGKPFVGAAGQLLTRIIHAMHLNRDMVYICNILKCRPPNNRKPEPDEMKHCFEYLEAQLDIIKPDIICTLGSTASQALLKVNTSISRMRGNFYDYKGIPVMPTFHPSYLLRNESKKKEVWLDMQQIMKRMQDSIST